MRVERLLERANGFCGWETGKKQRQPGKACLHTQNIRKRSVRPRFPGFVRFPRFPVSPRFPDDGPIADLCGATHGYSEHRIRSGHERFRIRSEFYGHAEKSGIEGGDFDSGTIAESAGDL